MHAKAQIHACQIPFVDYNQGQGMRTNICTATTTATASSQRSSNFMFINFNILILRQTDEHIKRAINWPEWAFLVRLCKHKANCNFLLNSVPVLALVAEHHEACCCCFSCSNGSYISCEFSALILGKLTTAQTTNQPVESTLRPKRISVIINCSSNPNSDNLRIKAD